MLRPDIALQPLSMPSMASLPLPAQGGSGAFSEVFRQAHAEVQQVIDRGWPGDPLPALRPEAWALRNQATAGTVGAAAAPLGGQQQEFLASIAPWARQAAQTLGVSADLVSAHAALESGWGQRPLRDAAGQNTHNLFGIKAQGGWQGTQAEARTTEYEDGVALGKTEAFRSYPDYASAFGDYARLLQASPRYRAALNTGADAQAFAQGLARGGYATDPGYAAKLVRLAEQIQSRD